MTPKAAIAMGLVADKQGGGQSPALMLTGSQISAARKLAGIGSHRELAKLAGVGEATIQRAEAEGDSVPDMQTAKMRRIILALEARGVEFRLDGGSLVRDISMRKR
jgi:DNA-binding XRE family transcriptional regulator